MQYNSWSREKLEQGMHLPRDELELIVYLACGEQPKMFVLFGDLRED
jgi:hypothetical protein